MSTTSTQEVFGALAAAAALGAEPSAWRCESFTGKGLDPGTLDAVQLQPTEYRAGLNGISASVTFENSDGSQYDAYVGASGPFELSVDGSAALPPPPGWTLVDAGFAGTGLEVWLRWGNGDGVTRFERRFSIDLPIETLISDAFTAITGKKLSV